MSWSELFEIPCKFPYEFHLHGLSDLQIGSESTSIRVIKRRIEEILDDDHDSGVVILGDIEDEDRPSTRERRKSAFADREEVISRDAEKHMAWIDKAVIPLLLPLQKTKHGIMGILAGHHWTQISPVLNSVQYIATQLYQLSKRKVPYLGIMSSFMDLRFHPSNGPNIRKVIHVQHGEGGGQTKSSSLLRLDRTHSGFIADAYIRAHDCQIVAAKTDQLYPKETRHGGIPDIMSKTIAFLNLGSATQGYNFDKNKLSYIENSMMRPTTMGWGSLYIKIRKAPKDEDFNQSYRSEFKIVI